jgi:hypothetical protein
VHDRPQQRVVLATPGGRPQGEPSQQFWHRHRPADGLREHWGQLGQRTWSGEGLRELIDELIAGQLGGQRRLPARVREPGAAEGHELRGDGVSDVGVGGVDRLEQRGEHGVGVVRRAGRDTAPLVPSQFVIVLAHEGHAATVDAEEASGEIARIAVATLRVGHRGRRGDVANVGIGAPTERTQATNEAGGLGALGSAESVGLVEDQKLEGCFSEDTHVLATSQEQLQLLDVGQQDAGLAAGLAHRVTARPLLGWQQRGRLAGRADLLEALGRPR